MISVSTAVGVDFDHGGYQQFALVGTTPNLTAKIPDNITDDEAATLPTAINTAQVALYDQDGHNFPNPFENSSFGKGKAFLVTGGSSIVGLAGKSPPILTRYPSPNGSCIPPKSNTTMTPFIFKHRTHRKFNDRG